MSVASHRAAIVAMLGAVPGVGLVHDEEPYARTEARFRELYQYPAEAGPVIRGWWVRRIRTRELAPHLGRVINVHTWRIRGFAALDSDAGTGVAFDDLVEAIRRAFRLDPTLDGVAQPGPVDQPSGVQVNDSGPVMFAGVLCHSADLALTTYDYLDADE